MSYLSITSSKLNFAAWFTETPIGLRLGPLTEVIWQMGTLHTIEPGDIVIAQGTRDRVLHVILTGRIQDGKTWYGPGNHLGADAILHDRPADEDAVATEPSIIWSLRMESVLTQSSGTPVHTALIDALSMLEPLSRAGAVLPRSQADATDFCDVDHPLIQETAARLRRPTMVETAIAIWAFVQVMPYRFGAWQESASQTLSRGMGMCTTKSNVQVALYRACGLEAGFVEVGLEMSILGLLIPDMWRYAMRPKVRHYFAAVRLDGRWHAADATFNKTCLDLFAQALPVLNGMKPYRFGVNEPFNPGAFVTGANPFDIDVRPDLAHEMSKSSRFEAHHFDSLNTRLDQAQGLLPPTVLAQSPMKFLKTAG